jgi:hypothetical protein
MSGQEENQKHQIPFDKNLPWAKESAGDSTPSGGSGISSRKVIDKDNIIETRYYLDGFELYRREVNGAIDYERTTLNISEEEKVFVRVEKKTNEPEVVRYQYDNHLDSACLELDYTGRIISYEEYLPFGTTSYRSGRSETEVSLKRYKYCGKERNEQTGFYYYDMCSNQSNVWVYLENLNTGVGNTARTEPAEYPNNPVEKSGQEKIDGKYERI